jgi:hypothetical protein
MVASFTHEDGRTWTPAERDRSYRKTKKAIAAGEIPPPEQLGCNRCKQKLGIIEYHNHDYDDPVKYLEPLCFRCHRMLHSRNQASKEKYFAEVAAGKQFPPVYRKAKNQDKN